ncbi:Alpha-galactosidase [Sphingomonas antarctica]|uniref:glycoside hydrolase family 36 protein n=1 Tax=Sphingomonas antarctica TaxID=2040274 RepID=UPI0039EA01CE
MNAVKSMYANGALKVEILAPLVDGEVPPHRAIGGGWALDSGGRVLLDVQLGRYTVRVEGVDRPLDSLGLRLSYSGARSYLRNGYHSWDGSFFVTPGTPVGDGPPGKAPTLGFAMTALLPEQGTGALVLGFERHDRFQTRFRYADGTIDVETLLDRTGATAGETLLLFDGDEVETALRRWSAAVAAGSPRAPRIPERRMTGWCSWYNLYAAIDEAAILDHLAAARGFRDAHHVPLKVFQIDDGFTPEMGDWLDVKPQFPRGMKPLLADVAAAGFRPGLWIAPFMVGNRSTMAQTHPDWLVKDATTGDPLVQMRFYGEFRWHKRSEEYHILDVTHPEAEAYIRRVFRTWAEDWGARYFKTDFMLFGSEHGPDTARWHTPGLSRIAIWRRMATLIREEIGEDALWLGCGCPLWASVGTVDAMRIGRDIGVTWHGEYSAESLLRDQLTRNHAANILWQADPDCILLRDRYHDLSDEQVRSLAQFAANAGGVLMTSDHLGQLSEARQKLFADALRNDVTGCDYPHLGNGAALIEQRVRHADGRTENFAFNPTGENSAVPPYAYRPA